MLTLLFYTKEGGVAHPDVRREALLVNPALEIFDASPAAGSKPGGYNLCAR